MKKIITFLSILVTAVLFTPNTAEARSHSHSSSTYVSGYSSCGCPIYTKKVFINHDRYGRPIYKYYSVPSNCNCHRKVTRPSRHHSSHRATYSNKGRCGAPTYYDPRSRHRSSGYTTRGTQIRVTYRR